MRNIRAGTEEQRQRQEEIKGDRDSRTGQQQRDGDSNRGTGTERIGQRDRDNNTGTGTVMEGQETRDRDSQTGKWTGRQGDWKTWTRDNNMDRKTGPKTEKQRQKYKEGQKQINGRT